MTMETANEANEASEIEPTGAPEEFGLQYDSAPIEKTRCWDRQEAFLAEYRTCRLVGVSANRVGLTRWAVDKWNQFDTHQFRARLKSAHADWRETYIEGVIDARINNPEGNRGSDVLLIFSAKAEDPEKYRETVTIIDTQDTKDMLTQLRRIGSPRVIEGKAKVIEE